MIRADRKAASGLHANQGPELPTTHYSVIVIALEGSPFIAVSSRIVKSGASGPTRTKRESSRIE